MTSERIKFLKDAIKWKLNGEEKRVRVSYSQGGYNNLPENTITIYGKNYKSLPRELNPVNNSDSQTDYFENDTVRVVPNSKYYKDVLKAMLGKEQSRELRSQKKASSIQTTDNALMNKIKKLAQVSEQNQLLDYELGGYIKSSDARKIFRQMAQHNVRHKKKYSYVDQGTSGRFLVATSGADVGNVFTIKGYGQRGYSQGNVDKVIANIEKSNASLLKGVMEKSLKLRKL